MTKLELIEAIQSIPDDTIVSMATITWGEVDLDIPSQVKMFEYVDRDMIKNIPDDILTAIANKG